MYQMQNLLKLHLILFSLLVFLFGCSSSDLSEKEEKASEENFDLSAAEVDYINISSSNNSSKKNYTKNILIPLERIDGCDYVVKGKIEYVKDGAVVATVDFGDGECDDIATKTVDGVDHEIKLNKKGKKHKKGKKQKN
jgi:hypothetical protein